MGPYVGPFVWSFVWWYLPNDPLYMNVLFMRQMARPQIAFLLNFATYHDACMLLAPHFDQSWIIFAYGGGQVWAHYGPMGGPSLGPWGCGPGEGPKLGPIVGPILGPSLFVVITRTC